MEVLSINTPFKNAVSICCLSVLFLALKLLKTLLKNLYRRVLGSFPTDFSLML